MKNKFWNMKNQTDGTAEIRIDGDIVSSDSFWGWLFDIDEVTPKAFREELAEHKGKDLTVWLNSNGGDVYAASAIYTALMEHDAKVTVKVDGTAISAASVIAMAGDEILMSPTSVMMIHNPWTFVEGEAKDLERYVTILNEVKETILNAYEIKTGMTRDEISLLMDEETWMGARKAIENGFADGMLYDEDPVEEGVQNGMLQGARMVFNSLRTRPKQVAQNKAAEPDMSCPVEDSQIELAKARLDIEKNRY